jgi:8-oxo-dGTP pyrophosphatase MutT (NUDIX family)
MISGIYDKIVKTIKEIFFAEKPDEYYMQSAVIPFQRKGDKIQIVIITSRNQKHWIIPKGIIEKSLSPQESAEKEAIEEAGVMGHVYSKSIGQYQYKKWGGMCTVQVFLLEVQEILDVWEEMNYRQRKIVPIEEAKALLTESALKKLLDKFHHFV